MTSRAPSYVLVAATLAACLALPVGCTTSGTTSKRSVSEGTVYFPAPPDAPRLQFLTSISEGSAVSRAQKKGSFTDWVVGTEPEKASSTRFASPYGVDARNGKIYVCDVAADRVHVVDMIAKTYKTLGEEGAILNPVNIKIDDNTEMRYVCDSGKRQILVFDRNDQFVRAIGTPTEWTPVDVTVAENNVYVCDVIGGQVWVKSKTGEAIRTISRKGDGPDELSMPTNLELGPDGNLYVVDSLQQIVKIFNKEGQFLGTVGGPGRTIGGFARPKGIALDDQGVTYVADSQWDVVQLFNPQGQLLMVFGEPGTEPHSMGLPAGLAIDRTSVSAFREYLAPNFQAEYLLFVVNQFGKNKLAIYAFGRDTSLSPDAYAPAPAAKDQTQAE